MGITVRVDEEKNVAIFVVTGTVLFSDLIDVASEQPEFEIANHLVDMTQADFSLLDIEGLREFVSEFVLHDKARPQGRTAVVISKNIDGSIVRLFKSLSEFNGNSPVAYKATFSRQEAYNWISESEG